MDNGLIFSPFPHVHGNQSSRQIMLDVIIALIPACIASIVIFGFKSLIIIVTCVASSVIFELLFDMLNKKDSTISDLSAIVTGILLALNLSTNVGIYECVVGSFFAIVVAKCLFGGLGHNFANPAIAGRVFMILTFSSVAGGGQPVDLVASATPLELLHKGAIEEVPSLMNMLLGVRGGTIGETCIIALLLGYIYLVVRKVIKWYVPASFIATTFVLFLVTKGFNMALYQILAGGLFLGAIFMATDYVSTPITLEGKVVFAVGAGILTFVIREFCSLPEGVSFAILTMNCLTPLIEKITANKPLGGGK